MSLESMPNLILYTTQDKKIKVELYELGESVYLSQDAIAKLFTLVELHLKKLRFDTPKQNVSLHIRNILKDVELHENLVVKDYLITAQQTIQNQILFFRDDFNYWI